MKHIFTLFAAAVMAVTVNAGTLTVDLNSAQGYGSEGFSSTPTVTNSELNVAWSVANGWDVAGVEFALDNLTGVSKINFDYKGNGEAITFYVYLVDANGGLKWEDEHWINLEPTDWTATEITPNADLWGNHGVEPWTKLVLVANPGSATSGTFSLRNLTITYEGGDPENPRPETAPAAPTHDEENVMALYCNHYATNNVNFNVLGWGGVQTWETLDLNGTNVLYCQDMKWEMMTNWDADSYDLSAYEKLHVDLWVPFAAKMQVTFEAQSGWKRGVQFNLNEGWNTIDADPAWWTAEAAYDWTDVKYIAFEGYMHPDSTSAEGNPFAFTNLYFWKSPAVVCPAAPADPKMAENLVTALFAHNYQTNTVNFAPVSWGVQNWVSPAGYEGAYFYSPAFTWDGFTNWDASSYNMTAYDMFSCDVWVEIGSDLKITFEALGVGDGGSGWKNGGLVQNLLPNQWNHVTVDLLNAPYDSYDFTDMRYMILEGFTNEGTALGIANAYFWDSMNGVENVTADQVAVKRLVNGHIVIEKNGVQYNMLGTQF
jgi:hypothetical protein